MGGSKPGLILALSWLNVFVAYETKLFYLVSSEDRQSSMQGETDEMIMIYEVVREYEF